MPVWFSFGSFEDNSPWINVGIVANTSGSENSSSSLQKEEIIDNASNPTYSPDGKSFAYVEKVGDKQVVVKDGVAWSKYTYVSNLTYSPDGKSFAYIAQQDDKMFVVKDGVEGSKEYVILSKLTYSPDSRHFAYIQEQFDSHPHLSDGKAYVVADWVVGIWHDEISNLAYSPDSQNLIYEVYHQWVMTFLISLTLQMVKVSHILQKLVTNGYLWMMDLSFKNMMTFLISLTLQMAKVSLTWQK